MREPRAARRHEVEDHLLDHVLDLVEDLGPRHLLAAELLDLVRQLRQGNGALAAAGLAVLLIDT